ncbi:hypothetical protein Acid345_0597 [Candidatus Koribacter versatilis Ellin345]|uniref:Transcriptional regulator n=1 Tax=Koribacter versatilis (strain Ellin345) TaxID=204669 RepID=Q1IU48_KORVE|nr:hypothetical protein [Candidatus Koribacter versatilis]ABF39602.1 hypothetical protein Acid345_0597 [Candidatus Koribacter versatilis Ellin345]
MDWAKFVTEKSREAAVLELDQVAAEVGVDVDVARQGLLRQEQRGLVEHLGKGIFLIRTSRDTSGRELINQFRPDAYLSLESVLRESGVSTQSPKYLTCITTGRRGEFRSKSFAVVYKHISPKLFWGFHEKRTLYGSYKVANPEKAILDWIYLARQNGQPADTDEFEISQIDRGKLLDYSLKYPKPVQQQIKDLLADFAAGRSGSPT